MLTWLLKYLGPIVALILASYSAAQGQRQAAVMLAATAVALWTADYLNKIRLMNRVVSFIAGDLNRQELFLRDTATLRPLVERTLGKSDADIFFKEVEGWTHDRRRRALEAMLRTHARRRGSS